MKKMLFLLIGVVIGFVVAHKVNENPQGRDFFEMLDKKTRDFSDVVSQGYREREAEIRSALKHESDH